MSPERSAVRLDRALPGMAERTIKIGSAGKIFSLTGWKVGWMIAAPNLPPSSLGRTNFSLLQRRPTCSRRWPSD